MTVQSMMYFLMLSDPRTSSSLISLPTAIELHNLPTRLAFNVRSPIVSGKKEFDNASGRQIGSSLLPTYAGKSNILSRIPQADRTLITCSTSHDGAFGPHPPVIKNRRVMVPWPHSSRSTHTSCSQLAAQLIPMIPFIPVHSTVSRYVVLCTSVTQSMVPSWFSTAIFSVSDFSAQVTLL